MGDEFEILAGEMRKHLAYMKFRNRCRSYKASNVVVASENSLVQYYFLKLLDPLRVKTVKFASDALRAAEFGMCDVLIADGKLYDMSVCQLIQTMRDRWPDVPVIETAPYGQCCCDSAGIITKPFEFRKVLYTVEEALIYRSYLIGADRCLPRPLS